MEQAEGLYLDLEQVVVVPVVVAVAVSEFEFEFERLEYSEVIDFVGGLFGVVVSALVSASAFHGFGGLPLVLDHIQDTERLCNDGSGSTHTLN